MADLYREKVTRLAEALEHPETRSEAAERSGWRRDGHAREGAWSRSPSGEPIDSRIAARDSGLRIELRGNLAAMLGAAQKQEVAGNRRPLVRMAMVAGAGFEPATFGL